MKKRVDLQHHRLVGEGDYAISSLNIGYYKYVPGLDAHGRNGLEFRILTNNAELHDLLFPSRWKIFFFDEKREKRMNYLQNCTNDV